MAKRKITLLYGEGTVQVYFRLPESKRNEIEKKFWEILKGYENPTKVEIEVSNPFKSREHPLKEKKSNPADDVLKVPAEKFGEKQNDVVGVSKLATTMNSTKKVDMDALRKIASGEGLKGTFSLTKKKVNIDEEYEFEYVKSIPDQDDQIVIDKKGLAFYSKYDLGVFYVKWEGKYMRFDSKAEFDRFGKEYLILI